MGNVISVEGVVADPEKVEAMQNWPTHKTITELREFLGLTGYYRRFVQDYKKKVRPLTILLKKNGFKWCGKTTRVFNELKGAMVTISVLRLMDF